jgi:hypothetical protein
LQSRSRATRKDHARVESCLYNKPRTYRNDLPHPSGVEQNLQQKNPATIPHQGEKEPRTPLIPRTNHQLAIDKRPLSMAVTPGRVRGGRPHSPPVNGNIKGSRNQGNLAAPLSNKMTSKDQCLRPRSSLVTQKGLKLECLPSGGRTARSEHELDPSLVIWTCTLANSCQLPETLGEKETEVKLDYGQSK